MSDTSNSVSGGSVKTLFSPIRVGPLMLSHRVVMAPLTRLRSKVPGDVPVDLMAEYYAQRASEGGLIISEGATVLSVAVVISVRLASIQRNKSSDGGGLRKRSTQGAGTSSCNSGM